MYMLVAAGCPLWETMLKLGTNPKIRLAETYKDWTNQ